ncbi:aminoacylase-1-like [Strongylocentrotus purpuratus]|uniref:Peptidase M20 dimerisation domain-containing protein n=1 Tax=Strongylocentrotus purpuratus TaxID=7668 RepID=A0A7M7PS15_STRPU|nr:aminoacylase-1-like [Strongylocentrotus purpuratus]
MAAQTTVQHEQGAEDPAVTNFRRYLRIKTVEPDPDYAGAIEFLKEMAGEMGLPVQCIEVHPGKTIVIITWEGTDPTLKSIILNSHIDVVPASADHWKCDPFEAKKMENGDIYARGTQDMKCVGIQYLEAIRRLIKKGQRLLRTVHMLFVPDEELGGFKGMKLFVQTPQFQKLNMGFGLDEGLANPTEKFTLFYGERATWWIDVICTGDPGHASKFVEDTAAEKAVSYNEEIFLLELGKLCFIFTNNFGVLLVMEFPRFIVDYRVNSTKSICLSSFCFFKYFCLQRRVMNAFLGYRDEEMKRLSTEKLGDIQTVNLVRMSLLPFKNLFSFMLSQGGVANNIVPIELRLRFDLRLSPQQTPEFLENKIKEMIASAGEGVSFEWIRKGVCYSTPLDDKNVWWQTFKKVCDEKKLELETGVFQAATDSCYIRALGIPVIGFSPINNTPILLHDHNEYLNEGVFLRGINIYESLISAIANVPE